MMRIRCGDDAGSMAIAMLVMVTGMGLSVSMLGATLSVMGGARDERARSVALQSARTGVSVVIANFRAAATVDADGVVTAHVGDLPCAPVSGTGASGSSSYSVTVTYLNADPTGHDRAWITANGVGCATNLPGGVPSFAYLESAGTDGLSGKTRTLFGLYKFRRLTDANIVGDQIQVFKKGSDTYTMCVDAGSGTPIVGTALTVRPCAVGADGAVVAQQKFGYEPNLTVKFITDNTIVGAPNGLCVDAGVQVVDAPLTLRACGVPTLTQQQWSFDWASAFMGTTDGVTVNKFCWSVVTADTPGSPVTLNDDVGDATHFPCNTHLGNDYQAWTPQPQVGAGGAGPANLQVVNFEQFGRCLDVAYADPTVAYEVAFQCKQAPTPDPTNNWNQTWHLPASIGPVYTVRASDAQAFCLTRNPVGTDPPVVKVTACDPLLPTPAEQNWWVRGGSTLTADERFRIEGLGAWSGLCLAVMPEYLAWPQAAKVGVRACTGDAIQKWNVDDTLTLLGLSGIGER